MVLKLSKQTLIVCMLLMSLLMVIAVSAEDDDETPTPISALVGDKISIGEVVIPPVAGDRIILPGDNGPNPPTDFAPAPNACDDAASSYVSPGMEVSKTTLITLGDIIYNNKDVQLVIYALYALEANDMVNATALYNPPTDSFMQNLSPSGNSIFEDDVVTIGNESACVTGRNMTARLWQLDNGEWAIDTLSFSEPLDITDSWPQQLPNNDGPLQIAQPQYPVLVDDVVFRYLMPYVEPPVTSVPLGGDEIKSNNLPHHVCDGAAPSYLNVGMDVMLSGYGYEKMPTAESNFENWGEWVFSDTQFALGNHGMSVFVDVLNTTPLVGIPGNLESDLQSVNELYGGVITPTGTIIDGPICTGMDVEPQIDHECNLGTWPQVPCIFGEPDPGPDRFYTWWQVEVNGVAGWYPENVGQYSHWLWTTDGIFPRKLFLYYMVPDGLAMQAQACPASKMYAGLDVIPAFGVMNLRNAPNGDVIGRAEANQIMTLFGTPTCEGGTNWWQTAGGFVAENDPETQSVLLAPAPRPVETQQPSDDPTGGQSSGDNPASEPTVEPTREPVNPTPRPTQTSDPTGAGSAGTGSSDPTGSGSAGAGSNAVGGFKTP